MKKVSAEDQCCEVMSQVEALQEHLTGSSPVGNEDDLEASCVDSFFLIVDAVEHLRQAMRREGYAVPKESL